MRLKFSKILNLLIIFVLAVKNLQKDAQRPILKTRQITCQKQENGLIVTIYLDLARMMHDAGQISIGLQNKQGQQEIARFPVSNPGIGKDARSAQMTKRAQKQA